MADAAPPGTDPKVIAEFVRLFRNFPRESVLHALPLLVAELLAKKPDAVIPESVERIVGNWMASHGLTGASTAATVAESLAATYAKRPIDPALMDELRQAFALQQTPTAGSFKALFGDRPEVAAATGTLPQGSVLASPLARFALRAPEKSQEPPVGG